MAQPAQPAQPDDQPEAFESGLIAELAEQRFKQAFASPVRLNERRIINLSSSDQALRVTDQYPLPSHVPE